MLVSIFFMLASISIIILVPMYTKKKNKFYSIRTNDEGKLKKQKLNIKTIWEIDKIKDSIITINGKHSIIIELGSVEYRLLNEEEQNNIDAKLTALARTFTFQTQFFSTIEMIDTNDKIENIRRNIANQKNEKIKEYGECIIEYLDDIMKEENLYVRKNYLIISSYDEFKKAENELKEHFNDISYSLMDIKVKTKLLSDMEIIELLNRELNKNCSEKIYNLIREGGLDFSVSSEIST